MKTQGKRRLGLLWVALLLCAAIGTAQVATTIGQGGKVERRQVRVSVEVGERVVDLWSRLEDRGLTTRQALLRAAATEPFSAYRALPAPQPDPRRFEGLFVPGTYRISLTVHTALPEEQQAYQRTLQLLSALLEEGQKRLVHYGQAGRLSLYQTAILASIVEKENVPRQDYADVASVFLNRLAAGMRLGSCPSLEYSLGYHRPFLLNRDIAVDTPYNTYLHPGLPPTPICFFSDPALTSLVHPVSTGYYFFVLDWAERKIYFARTYAEHLGNVKRARQDFVRRYGARSLFRKQPGKYYEQ